MHGIWLIYRRHPLAVVANLVLLAALLAAIAFDRSVALWVAEYLRQAPRAHLVWSHLTEIGRAEPYIVTAIVAYLWLKFAPMQRVSADARSFWASHASLLLASLALSGLVVNLAKPLIGRLRPRYLIADSSYGLEPMNFVEFGMNSFPSGHSQTIWVAAIVALLVLKACAQRQDWSNRKIEICGTAALIVLAAVVAASRVILNKHFVSDVLVGSLIGALTPIWLYPRWVLASRQQTGR